MLYKHAKYDSLITKITNKDLLFFGNYTIDPYQNCEFGCKYCDSALDETIYIKTNSIQLLEEEITKIEEGTIIVGSVHDPYQKIEKEYEITRNLLNIIKQHNFSCHILTKSNLVLRDIDILSKINNCVVTISTITLNESISNVFETKVPLPAERLKILKKLSENKIKTGLAIMPVLPFIVEEEFEKIIKAASKNGADYVLHKNLELKGDHKSIFLKTLEKFNPNLIDKYAELYGDSYMPDQTYILKINNMISKYCKKYGLHMEI